MVSFQQKANLSFSHHVVHSVMTAASLKYEQACPVLTTCCLLLHTDLSSFSDIYAIEIGEVHI